MVDVSTVNKNSPEANWNWQTGGRADGRADKPVYWEAAPPKKCKNKKFQVWNVFLKLPNNIGIPGFFFQSGPIPKLCRFIALPPSPQNAFYWAQPLVATVGGPSHWSGARSLPDSTEPALKFSLGVCHGVANPRCGPWVCLFCLSVGPLCLGLNCDFIFLHK